MNASPQPPWPPPRAPRMSAGRIVALVLGLLLLLPAAGLLLGGGVLMWADGPARSDGGYLFTETDDFSTAGHALVSERIELATDADWLPFSAALCTARAEVTPVDPGTDIFVGIAPAAEGSAYLEGVERSVVDDLGTGTVDEVPLSGGPPSGPPGEQDFWFAQSSGPGTQTLDWEPAEGEWLFVVMNADGSAGVAMDVRIGATLPALGGLAWGLLVSGLLCLVLSVLLLVLAIRRPSAPAGPAPGAFIPPPRASGPPPAWTPPGAVDRPVSAEAQPGAGAPPRDPSA